MQVVQPAFWNGPPERLPDAFHLTKPKGDHRWSAVCQVWTHPYGWELRLIIGGHGMQMTSVVRSDGEMHATTETWKAALLGKGWHREAVDPEPPVPTAPAATAEILPLDDAPVPPLTAPTDTEGL